MKTLKSLADVKAKLAELSAEIGGDEAEINSDQKTLSNDQKNAPVIAARVSLEATMVDRLQKAAKLEEGASIASVLGATPFAAIGGLRGVSNLTDAANAVSDKLNADKATLADMMLEEQRLPQEIARLTPIVQQDQALQTQIAALVAPYQALQALYDPLAADIQKQVTEYQSLTSDMGLWGEGTNFDALEKRAKALGAAVPPLQQRAKALPATPTSSYHDLAVSEVGALDRAPDFYNELKRREQKIMSNPAYQKNAKGRITF